MPELDIEPPRDARELEQECNFIRQRMRKYEDGQTAEDRDMYRFYYQHLLERQSLYIAILAIDVIKKRGSTNEQTYMG